MGIFCGGMAIAVGDNLGKGLEGLKKKADGLPLLGMGCFGEQAFLPGAKECVQRNLSLVVLYTELHFRHAVDRHGPSLLQMNEEHCFRGRRAVCTDAASCVPN